MGGVELRREQRMNAYEHGNLRSNVLLSILKSDVSANALGPSSAALQQLSTAAQHRPLENGLPVGRFAAALHQECYRVGEFYRSRHKQLWNELLDVVVLVRTAGHPGSEAAPAALRQALESVGARVVELGVFAEENAAAAAQIAQAADAAPRLISSGANLLHGGTVCPQERASSYLEVATRAVVGSLSLDSLILGLSDAYELLRRVEDGRAGGDDGNSHWVAPQSFMRVTRKFWLRPSDVALFKTEVVKHLPVLLYGDRLKLGQVDPQQLPFLAPPPTLDSAAVSSVYLDSFPDLSSYHSRLHREDKATAVRVRWYGQSDPADPRQKMFVERKMHRAKWTGEFSVKQRAAVDQSEVAAFLAGQQLRQGQDHPDAAFLEEVQSHIVAAGQGPALRTVYQRTAFQEDSNNLVRISLDNSLSMARDGPEPASGWCRSDPAVPADAERFPYCVVEVKLQAPPGQWLKDLVSSGMLIPAPKFSKFLHGMAALYPEAMSEAPYWFLADEADPERLTPATWDEMAAAAELDVSDPGEWLYPNFSLDFTSESQDVEARSRPPKSLRPATKLFITPRPSPQESTVATPKEDQATMRELLAGQPRRTPWRVYQAPSPVSAVILAGVEESSEDGAADARSSVSRDSQACTQMGGATAVSAAAMGTNALEDVEAGQAAVALVGLLQPNGSPPHLDAPTLSPGAKPAVRGGDGGKLGSLTPSSSGSPGQGLSAPAAAGSIKGQCSRPRTMVRTRVEPKTFFANERTFLQWLNISVLVMFLAMSLLSGSALTPMTGSAGGSTGASGCPAGDSRCFAARLSGALIAPVALAFMAYALYQYRRRTYQIMRQEITRYDDQRGPVILVVILLCVMLISYVVAVVYVF